MELIARLKPYWAWVLSVVLVAGALAVVWSTGPDDGDLGTRPGQFLAGTVYPDDVVDTGVLRFPGTTLTVGLTAPITTPRRDHGPAGRTVPDGGSFLGVDPLYGGSVQYAVAGTATDRSETAMTLAVIADGRRYPLRAPDVRGAGDGYLAVAGRPENVTIEATVDGVRQTVTPRTGARDVGPAQGLYQRATPADNTRKECGRGRLTAGYRVDDNDEDLPQCEITRSVRTPYVVGLGWAARGRTWQVVELDVGRSLRVERAVAGRPVQTYTSVTSNDDLVVRFDGRTTVGSPRVNAGSRASFDTDAMAVGQVALDAPPVTVQIVSTHHRLRNRSADANLPVAVDPRAPVGPDVSVTWTETLS